MRIALLVVVVAFVVLYIVIAAAAWREDGTLYPPGWLVIGVLAVLVVCALVRIRYRVTYDAKVRPSVHAYAEIGGLRCFRKSFCADSLELRDRLVDVVIDEIHICRISIVSASDNDRPLFSPCARGLFVIPDEDVIQIWEYIRCARTEGGDRGEYKEEGKVSGR